ncbi:MAG: peptidase [Chloroflexi bacterium]|jgi:pyroglutamyl-peptidase|nr:peptidase [Chloroflexota bacterium]
MSGTKTILLTGYEPFDRFPYNPSGVIAEALDGKELADGYVIRGAVLPVDCVKMPGVLYGLFEKYQPQVVIGLGLAFSETGLRIERVGHNWSEITGLPDNGGHNRPGIPLLPDVPAAYFSTFPSKQIVADLLEAGIPAHTSDHAGGHLCNEMLFTALHAINAGAWQHPSGNPVIAGFIHLPATPQLAVQLIQTEKHIRNIASMSLDLMQQGVEQVLTSTIQAV